MKIDVTALRRNFALAQRGSKSRHEPADRTKPSPLQYDFLVLSRLSRDVRALVGEVPAPPPAALALDLGSDKSPYRELLQSRGFEVRTLDVSADGGADYVGTAEETGLPSSSLDLVLCTQVLEHSRAPWDAIREIARILKPGGHCIFTVPHAWFYHPHPADYWRFTQEGVLELCRHGGLEVRSLLSQGGSALAGAQVLAFLAYGVLGRFGAPLYALLNGLGAAADAVAPNELFPINFACLAAKPEAREA